MNRQVKFSKAPWTYLNRLKLKKRFKGTVDAAVTRERNFSAGEEAKKGEAAKRLFFIAFIVFSSSLLGVLRGKISRMFVAGVLLIGIVSLIPVFYKRYKLKGDS